MDNRPDQEPLIGYDEYDQSGFEQIRKRKWKQRIGMIVIILILLAVVTASLLFFFFSRKTENTTQDEQGGREFSRNNQSSMISAVGTTAIGRDEVNFDIDFLEDTELYVEEVFISSGDEVEAGTQIIKFTEDSIADARNELEEALENATLSYQGSVITTKESQISLQYTYEKALLDAQQAQGVYDDALASLQAELDTAKSAYDDAQEAYDTLYNQIANNTFYADYEVAEKKQAYTEAKEIYNERYLYWEITEEELQSSAGSGSGASSGAAGGRQGANTEEKQAQQDRSWIVKTMQLIAQEVETAEAEYETAQQECEDAIAHAELNLKKLASELEKAKNTYEETSLKYQKDSLAAKTTYETAMAKSKTAQSEYEMQLESLSESLDKLKDAMDEAQEHVDTFETEIGDGYLYATESGTILMIRVQAGDVLAGSDMVMAYSKPSEITVSVAVSQDAISQLCVGDTANIIIEDHNTFTGTITTMNPFSASDSKTAVTYTVTIALEGDVSELSENLTATVVFGDMPTQDGKNDMMQDGKNMPTQGSDPNGAEMPMMPNSEGGAEMPNGNADTTNLQKSGMGEPNHE